MTLAGSRTLSYSAGSIVFPSFYSLACINEALAKFEVWFTLPYVILYFTIPLLS
jgi:hypothetical protein